MNTLVKTILDSDDTATAEMEEWIDAAVSSLKHLGSMFSLEEKETIEHPEPTDLQYGSYVELEGQHCSYLFGIVGPYENLKMLSLDFLGFEADDDSLELDEICDCIGEISNILVGQIKRVMTPHHPKLMIGLPTFIKGNIQKQTNAEQATLKVYLGAIPLRLFIVKQPHSVEKIERNRLEKLVREREEKYNAILNTAAEGIITTDEEWMIGSFNPAAENIFHQQGNHIAGKSIELIIPEIAKVFSEKGSSQTINHEVVGKRDEQSTFPLELSISHFNVQNHQMNAVIVRDITSRKKLEEELLQSQKLESIGQLAAGIAHEINTPVQFINK